ncbi:MAG TPA: hypothetical protein VKV16_07670 [Solirubrobacteraceae bacterium]|nr:hypothetical protein [Solirubrobacteraceae bacterium]
MSQADADTDGPARGNPPSAPPGEPASGIAEPAGEDPGAVSGGRDPHHVLNNPVGEPDPTEWPDPYERRPDPRYPDAPTGAGEAEDAHTPTGALSTSEPHPGEYPGRDRAEAPERDNLDE